MAQLLTCRTGQVVFGVVPDDFDALAKQLRTIDRRLLPITRDLDQIRDDIVSETYADLLNQRMHKIGLKVEDLINKLHNKKFLRELCKDMPKPSLTIDIARNLREFVYRCPSGKALSVKDPKLLWDCQCDTPSERTNDFKCPIHCHPLGDEVQSRFYGGYVVIRYRELSFYWRNGQELWPPSVDSFAMLQDLEKGRAIELDALLTVVQEMGRLVDVETPTIDTVLALTQQMGRVAGVYPTFPQPDLAELATKGVID